MPCCVCLLTTCNTAITLSATPSATLSATVLLRPRAPPCLRIPSPALLFSIVNRYDTLFDYGLPPNGAPTDPDDADPNLVPRLVELVALPLLDHLVARCWDPLSARASGRVVRAVEEVLIYVEASNEGIQRLLRAAEDRMGWAVQQCEVRSELQSRNS